MKWSLQQRNIKDLLKHPKNPRTLSKDQAQHLSRSIDKFGLIDKPIINTDNTIIGGHQRLHILKQNKQQTVECWVPDETLSQNDIDELNIRLNKNTGDWNWDILANEWDSNKLIEWGFSNEELDYEVVENIESEEDSEVLEPAKDEDAYTKLGDIYDLNDHRICCGDSTSLNIWSNFPESEICFTSPPYNLGKSMKLRGNKKKANDENAYDIYDDDSDHESYKNLIKMVISNAMIYSDYQFINIQILSGNKVAVIEIMHEFKDHFADILFWKKTQVAPMISKNAVNSAVELILIFANQKNPKRSIKTATFSQGSFSNLIVTESASQNEFAEKHAATFPVAFAYQIVKNFCSKSCIDPFMGTGTTLIACEQIGRICYGIEISPAYCDIIVKRWVKWMQKNSKQFSIKKNGQVIDFSEMESHGL